MALLHDRWRTATRLIMVVLSAAGMSPAEIAALLDYHPATVRRWLHRFTVDGIAGLPDRPRPGRPRLGGSTLTTRIGLNEVPIGIPMPAVYVRMLAYAWGEPVAARTCLLGEMFTPAQAHALGMVHELVPAGDLLDRAVAIAEQTPEDCLGHVGLGGETDWQLS